MIPNPNKLNIEQMWKLYGLLKKGINKKIGKDFLEESKHIIRNISDDSFREGMLILYGDNYKSRNPMIVATMFVSGLQKIKFFTFVGFARKLSNGS